MASHVDHPPHVVMAVANPIVSDARVRKSAQAVADLGYRVTLVWAAPDGGPAIEGDLNGVRTIGLPVPYHLHQWSQRRRAERGRRPIFALGLGYASAERRRAQAALLAVRRSRLGGAAPGFGLRAAMAVHRLRSKVFSLLQAARLKRAAARRAKLAWQDELTNIADLEGVFTPWLTRLEPDILHLHDIHLLGAGVNAKRALRARGRQVKLIYDAHEYVADMGEVDPAKGRAFAAMERELVAEADGVETVSDPIADRLERELALSRRPTVVLNTPLRAAGQDRVGGPDLRAQIGLPPETPLVVYAGVLHTNRNLVALIEAVKLLPEVHLALVCVPNAHYPVARQLGARAAELNLADRVALVEPVAPEELIGFLSSATMGIHPMALGLANHEMALPNKLFDYVWAGLPVAVSRLKTMGDFVAETGVGVTFDPEDRQSIADAIGEIVGNRQAYADRARDPKVKDRYCWEVQAAKLADLYRSVAGPDPSAKLSPGQRT
ncbi:MAG: glycosyltransferase family 4 protein [Bifidobacteriaceae bacterium]|nr:glycosyltransferase family 4 protein [Bifidobacteriaceae bacterium]